MVEGQKRWLALIVLCLGSLMIVLDGTIVNVALPTIRADLHFSDAGLVWVVNAYMLTYGGFLLLGGRLGDIYGPRRLFLMGIGGFTLASLACGLSTTREMLITARAVQGLGGAVVSAVALSLIMNMFQDGVERAKAMGVYGFTMAGGGSVGLLLGGTLTSALDWHWIFLVNLPLGAVVYGLCMALLPSIKPQVEDRRLDLWGAITVTSSLMLAVYAIVNGNEAGWTSVETLALLGVAILLLVAFILIESRTKAPLIPLSIFRIRSLSVANIIGVLWAAAMFTWFFITALYLQLVLGFGPLQVGLAFLPANIIMAVFSLGVSAKLVTRFGIPRPLSAGLLFGAAGLAWFARAPVGGDVMADVLPSMVLLGLGAGIAFNPLLIAAMNDVPPSQSGLASGVVNTAFMMGGSLGLAILASLAAAQTSSLTAHGASALEALNGGYHVSFLVGAASAALAAFLGAAFLRTKVGAPAAHGAPAPSLH